MGEHQEADKSRDASHARKHSSLSETRDRNAAEAGSREPPKHHQKDKDGRLVGLILSESKLAPRPPHRTLDRKTQKHTSEYFGLYIVIRRYLHRYFEPYENNGLLIFFFTTKIINTGIFSRISNIFSFKIYKPTHYQYTTAP